MLWGTEVFPRSKSLIELYEASGRQRIFILDRGQKHGASRDMNEHMLEFFRASRRTLLSYTQNRAQLKCTLFIK